jgi:hypothetical protein
MRHHGFEAEVALARDASFAAQVGAALCFGDTRLVGALKVQCNVVWIDSCPKSTPRARNNRGSVVFPEPFGPATISTKGARPRIAPGSIAQRSYGVSSLDDLPPA